MALALNLVRFVGPRRSDSVYLPSPKAARVGGQLGKAMLFVRRCVRALHGIVPAAFVLSIVHAVRADETPKPSAPSDSGNEVDEKRELTVFPLVGGDSDVGIGGGFIGSLAQLDPGYKPFRWRVESVAVITFKDGSGDRGLVVPFQDYYVKITAPHLIPNRLRLTVRPSFNWLSSIKYYGLGNDSKTTSPNIVGDKGYFEYERVNPTLRASVQLTVAKGFSLVTGAAYSQNWVSVPENSKLADDMRGGSKTVRDILGGTRPHGVLAFEYGAIWDTRDNETSPKQGFFHQVTLKLAPGGTETFLPYQWGNANLTLRHYLPLGTPRVVLASRLVTDILFGQAPFYELSRFEDSYAIGGVNGVRGVPGQRYYGKVKLFGNVELRTELYDFHFWRKKFIFGAVGFFDGGRLWTDFGSHPELDGTGIGLKFGVGGGLRLQAGESFLIRADVAWSPDANPIGAYFAAGHLF